MTKFYFDFISSGHGLKEIEEPVGMDGADFTIEQPDGRNGRDVTYAGGNNNLRIESKPQHCFEEMLYNRKVYGYNAVVKFIIEIDEVKSVIGEVDFELMETDDATYIEFMVIEEGDKAKLKRRSDIQTNLFSPTDLDGNPIEPCLTTNILLKAKPVISVSEWGNTSINKEYASDSLDGDYIMPLLNQLQYDIKDSLAWLDDYDEDTGDNIRFIEAKTNLRDVNIDINISAIFKYRPQEGNTEDIPKLGVLRLYFKYGQTYDTATEIDNVWFHAFYGHTDQQITLPENISLNIPFINNTDKLWIYFRSSSQNGAVNRFNVSSMNVNITATSIAYNTIVPVVRLIDAIKYVVKSASGLEVSAPRWEFGGEFYDQYITTTPLMRNLLDKPFNLSFKDIVDDYFPEAFTDYQIQQDGTVFIGNYADYYRDFQMADFRTRYGCKYQLEGYSTDFNKRYCVNRFTYGYDNYASQKENETANTYDLVHGDSEWMLPNNGVENKKEVKVGWIRDAFYIEQQRRKAYDLTDTAATQDDDKVYLIDVVDLRDWDREYTETASLKHNAPGTFVLELTNDQTFSWLLLGLAPGDTFTITSSVNAAPYTITNVTDSYIRLVSQNSYEPVNNASTNTTFKYRVSNGTTLVNRTSEGFSLIQGIEDGNNYANLKYTVKSNIFYYGRYLASCMYYAPDGKSITNTLYKNNPLATTQTVGGVEIQEGRSFVPVNPLVTPVIHKPIILMTLYEFLELEAKVRNERGYISFYTPEGLHAKGYIQKATWTATEDQNPYIGDLMGQVEAVLEEKYQQFYIEIVSLGDGSIVIDSDITTNSFDYEIDNFQNLHIFDAVGKLISPPVPYNRVRVNNSGQATSALELAQWLESIQ